MAGGLRCRRGGIRSLLELIAQHQEAIEYDLLTLPAFANVRLLDDLGTPRLSWRDLWVVVRQSPHTSALSRALDPDWEWTLSAHFLAGVFNVGQIANWQRAGGKAMDKPRLVRPPGSEPTGQRLGSDAISIEEMDKALGWNQPTEGAS